MKTTTTSSKFLNDVVAEKLTHYGVVSPGHVDLCMGDLKRCRDCEAMIFSKWIPVSRYDEDVPVSSVVSLGLAECSRVVEMSDDGHRCESCCTKTIEP